MGNAQQPQYTHDTYNQGVVTNTTSPDHLSSAAQVVDPNLRRNHRQVMIGGGGGA